MIKRLLNDSKFYLLQHKNFTKLTFMISFCRFFYIVLLLAYNVNSLLTYKMEKWLSVFTLFQYFLDWIRDNNLIRLVIVILSIFAIWYWLGYPIWISANIHYLEKWNDSIWWALSSWIKDFFKVFELNGLAFSFWPYMYFSTLFRLYILDVLDSSIAIWLVIVRWIAVLFSSIFWQYSKYILILEWKDDKKIWVSESLRKSIDLTISNFGLTIKGFFAKILVTILFYFKIVIVITIPLLVIYFLITSNIVWNGNQRIIRTLWIMTMIIATYMLTSTQAFFFKFWHLLYKEAKKEW